MVWIVWLVLPFPGDTKTVTDVGQNLIPFSYIHAFNCVVRQRTSVCLRIFVNDVELDGVILPSQL